jgi:hypothetical protein
MRRQRGASDVYCKRRYGTENSKQPEDSTYDEILRELALARMIEQRGLQNSQHGRTAARSTMTK